MKKVIRNNKVAILYSPGWGAGWMSWADDEHEQLLFHPDLVKWVEDGKKDDIDEIVDNILGEDHGFYTGGSRDLAIEWLNVGTDFRIDEYDGHETIVTYSDLIYKA